MFFPSILSYQQFCISAQIWLWRQLKSVSRRGRVVRGSAPSWSSVGGGLEAEWIRMWHFLSWTWSCGIKSCRNLVFVFLYLYFYYKFMKHPQDTRTVSTPHLQEIRTVSTPHPQHRCGAETVRTWLVWLGCDVEWRGCGTYWKTVPTSVTFYAGSGSIQAPSHAVKIQIKYPQYLPKGIYNQYLRTSKIISLHLETLKTSKYKPSFGDMVKYIWKVLNVYV